MSSSIKNIKSNKTKDLDTVVISHNYPSNSQPNRGAFVYNLVQELAKQGIKIRVIAPIKLHEYFFSLKNKRNDNIAGYGNELCKVYRPIYITLGNRKILSIDLGKITFWFMQLSVRWCYKHKVKKCDLLYAHFLINAMTVLKISQKQQIPLVVASGESKYRDIKLWSQVKLRELIHHISHYVAVSQYNKDELLGFGATQDCISIIPNAVDYDRFYPKNKIESRQKFKLDTEKFIVGFIGHFIDRKGPNRLIEAVEKINDAEIVVVCVGKGEIIQKDFVKIIAPMPNDQLPDLINCFDIFVLPTLAEGHCNIIEEVMACGIPVVSSLGTSVENQINDEIGVLVDPLNIDEIASAIIRLKADQSYRNHLQENLLKKRGAWSLKERAEEISKIYKKVAEC